MVWEAISGTRFVPLDRYPAWVNVPRGTWWVGARRARVLARLKTSQAWRRILMARLTNTLDFGNDGSRGRDPSQRWVQRRAGPRMRRHKVQKGGAWALTGRACVLARRNDGPSLQAYSGDAIDKRGSASGTTDRENAIPSSASSDGTRKLQSECEDVRLACWSVTIS